MRPGPSGSGRFRGQRRSVTPASRHEARLCGVIALCYDRVVNAPYPIGSPHPVKLTVDDFLLLRQAGAFTGFSKSELLEGRLSGVPHKDADGSDWRSDASLPVRLRSSEYEMLAEAGAFDEIGRTELVDGIVYAMSPQYRAHGYATSELAYRLRRALEALASPLYVAFEQSVDLAPHSEPQPGVILTTAPRGEGAIPAASVALLVEVSVTTRAFDLGEKAAVYAAAGVPEYWVVDVRAGTIHQLWSPGSDGYAKRREVAFGAPVDAVTIAGLAVGTADLV